MRRISFAVATLVTLLAPVAQAAEIKAMITGSTRSAIEELVPRFERASGHKVSATYDIQQVLFRQIEAGAPFDVMVLSINVDNLVNKGWIAPGTRTALGRTGVGVAVRKGASKPDFSTVDAFKRMLLEAKSLTHSEGSSGKHFLGLLERLSMTEAIKPKIVQPVGSGGASRLVAAGKAELAVIGLPPVLAVPGLDWLGWLPDELNDWIVFTGGVATARRRSPPRHRPF
jgi:molybdate transport system substrate-binding protein